MTPVCPLCQGHKAVRFFESRDRIHKLPGVFTVFRCNLCEAIFYQPSLQDEELSRYYPDSYGRYRPSRSLGRKGYQRGMRRFVLENYYDYPSEQGNHRSLLKKGLAFFLSFVLSKDAIPYRGEGNFLDIGCGGGSYLYRLKQWGWNVYGVEPGSAGVAQARSLGINVHHGQIGDAGFPNNFFDAIRLSHVLEHLTDPQGTFREIRRILKTDGIVYITVPNTRSLNFRLFGENWYGLDSPRHVISYCPGTLKFLCEATGFGIVNIRFRSGAFNFVRSMQYLIDEKGDALPGWVKKVDWVHSRAIRRTLKPFFFLVDILGWGDVMHSDLMKADREKAV